MAATVRSAIRELMEQTMATMDALVEASDRELSMPSSHACAQGKDVWTLIANAIDHEKIHTGQILEARYESRITASPMQRLVAEWLAERARLRRPGANRGNALENAEGFLPVGIRPRPHAPHSPPLSGWRRPDATDQRRKR